MSESDLSNAVGRYRIRVVSASEPPTPSPAHIADTVRTPPAPETPPWESQFTCDWGNCDRETVAWRYSGQRFAESPLGWLPVCRVHSKHGVVTHIDGGVCG